MGFLERNGRISERLYVSGKNHEVHPLQVSITQIPHVHKRWSSCVWNRVASYAKYVAQGLHSGLLPSHQEDLFVTDAGKHVRFYQSLIFGESDSDLRSGVLNTRYSFPFYC